MPILSNAKHEKFAQGVASGLSASAAWLTVNPKATPESAKVTASRALTRANVQARIQELQAPAIAATVSSVERWLRRVWAIAEQDKPDRVQALAQLRPILFPDLDKATVDARSLVFNLPDGTTLEDLRALRDGLK